MRSSRTSPGSVSVSTRARCGRASGEPVRGGGRSARSTPARASATTRARCGSRGDGTTLLRPDGTATYQLASVVDDLELGITHVIRGSDHRPNLELHQRIARAVGGELPEVIHHGLVLGPDGKKLSKRHGHSSIAELREEGFPPAGGAGVPRRARAPRARRPARPPPARDGSRSDAIAAMTRRGAGRGGRRAASRSVPVLARSALAGRGARVREARPRTAAGRARRRRAPDARALRRASTAGARSGSTQTERARSCGS